MTNDQGTGVVERVIYGAILAALMKLVAKGWLSADMAPYLAGGAVMALGGLYAFWINRPKAIVQAARALPDVKGVVTNNTIEGRALAASIPGTDVAAAGTLDAKVIAATGATS